MADKFQLKALITGVDKLSPMLKGIQQKAGSFRKQLEKSGLGKMDFGSIAAGGALAAPIVVGVKAAMDFESKMADVKKVVDFDTPEQFKQMGADVLSLSEKLPMAASGIAEIVAAGGQSGIARTELKEFAGDAVKMGVAFDLTAGTAGEMMAKWRTAFSLGQKGVVELADKINYLGNTGPAKADKISGIVTRIGALGGIAGLTTAQVAAMGATMIGVGVQEDVAATGMKNFVLALTSGTAATKAQSNVFKALRMDSKQVSVAMQKDAQGTILKVLTAISKVDDAKRPAVLSELFGKESIESIGGMLTKLDLLKGNFEKVADSSQYAGSMNKEYAARAATTANNLQLLVNRVTKVGIVMGTVLLPPFNDFMEVIGPVVTGVGDLAAANPWLIKGLLGAGLGFVALKLAVMGTIGAMKLFAIVSNISPLGFAIRAIALLAGFMIANWSEVAPWFQDLWRRLVIVGKFAWEMFKGIFSWTPLGMVIKNWEPIVEWFGRMWDRIKPFLQPILDGAGKVVEVAGRFFASSDQPTPQQQAASETARRTGWVANDRSLEGTRHSIVTQSAQAQKAQMSGRIEVDFKNAPEGMQVSQAKTDQPGLEMTPFVGYRSLGRRRVAE